MNADINRLHERLNTDFEELQRRLERADPDERQALIEQLHKLSDRANELLKMAHSNSGYDGRAH
jgi:hypothetical protein